MISWDDVMEDTFAALTAQNANFKIEVFAENKTQYAQSLMQLVYAVDGNKCRIETKINQNTSVAYWELTSEGKLYAYIRTDENSDYDKTLLDDPEHENMASHITEDGLSFNQFIGLEDLFTCLSGKYVANEESVSEINQFFINNITGTHLFASEHIIEEFALEIRDGKIYKIHMKCQNSLVSAPLTSTADYTFTYGGQTVTLPEVSG